MNREQFNDILWKIRQSCKANEIDIKNIYVVSDMIQAATKIYLDEINHERRQAPEPKTGHWIVQPSNKERGERDFIWWKCSECGAFIFSETEGDRRRFHAFCGRCGAKMVESQESKFKYADTDTIRSKDIRKDEYTKLEQEPFINKSCVSSGVCEHDKNKVLDKIRAEIEDTYINLTYKENYKAWGLRKALEIIDKYKAESERK